MSILDINTASIAETSSWSHCVLFLVGKQKSGCQHFLSLEDGIDETVPLLLAIFADV
jgi:hypothetical protein